jgi:3-phosphoshikimate 1-carboxyvinyltransferase
MVMPLPHELEIRPRTGPIDARVHVPGSKSLSNRALLIAGLAEGNSTLTGLLDSDDTQVMARAMQQLGARIDGDWTQGVAVRGVAGRPRVPIGPIDVHASGTAARFLTAALALIPGETVLDGNARMRQRPINDLVTALAQLGVEISILGQNGCPPVRGSGGSAFGGDVEVDASRSSQYISALLQIAPYASTEVTLHLKNGVLVSKPYVDVTLAIMQAFGAEARFVSDHSLRVSRRHPYRARRYAVEPDASTAAYFFAAAALSGGRVVVEDLPGHSAQADMGLLGVFERMGAQVTRSQNSVIVQGSQAGLSGVEVDMNSMPDAVLALAVAAAFANGPTVIRNVANLRIKETDRLHALETELRKLGAGAETGPDWLKVTPAPMHGAVIDTYDDHRVAMAFALAGLRVPGVVIREPGCVSKSWPGYFDAFSQL